MDRQKLTSTILVILEAGFLCAVLVIGVLTNAAGSIRDHQNNKQSEQVTDDDTQGDTATEDISSSEDVFPGDETTEDTQSSENPDNQGGWFETEQRETFAAAVEQKLASMTTEEKVAQLFLVSPESITGVDRVTVSGRGTKNALNQYPVGGFIYSKKNFMGSAQASSLINGAQGYAQERIGLPLFILIKDDAPDYTSYATLTLTPQTKGALAMEVGATPARPDGILTCTYTTTIEIVAAIKDGMDMIYAPDNFTEIYGVVLTAVNDGTISQVRLENAVGRVLTEKME